MKELQAARLGDQEFTSVLGYQHLKQMARDWTTFTSATPFRVPIPEESALRPVRQYPIETDPPEHGSYRRLVEARYSRSAAESHRPAIAQIVTGHGPHTCLGAPLARMELAVVSERFLAKVGSTTLVHPTDWTPLRTGTTEPRFPAAAHRSVTAVEQRSDREVVVTRWFDAPDG